MSSIKYRDGEKDEFEESDDEMRAASDDSETNNRFISDLSDTEMSSDVPPPPIRTTSRLKRTLPREEEDEEEASSSSVPDDEQKDATWDPNLHGDESEDEEEEYGTLGERVVVVDPKESNPAPAKKRAPKELSMRIKLRRKFNLRNPVFHQYLSTMLRVNTSDSSPFQTSSQIMNENDVVSNLFASYVRFQHNIILMMVMVRNHRWIPPRDTPLRQWQEYLAMSPDQQLHHVLTRNLERLLMPLDQKLNPSPLFTSFWCKETEYLEYSKYIDQCGGPSSRVASSSSSLSDEEVEEGGRRLGFDPHSKLGRLTVTYLSSLNPATADLKQWWIDWEPMIPITEHVVWVSVISTGEDLSTTLMHLLVGYGRSLAMRSPPCKFSYFPSRIFLAFLPLVQRTAKYTPLQSELERPAILRGKPCRKLNDLIVRYYDWPEGQLLRVTSYISTIQVNVHYARVTYQDLEIKKATATEKIQTKPIERARMGTFQF